MLSNVKRNIEKLIEAYEHEKQHRIQLEVTLEEKETIIDSYRKQIADLERQVDNLKLTEAFIAPAGSDSAAKEKIEKMIAEIDRCIALLDN